MSRFLLRTVRPIASALALALVVVSSAECLTMGNATPEQHACCASMQQDCDRASMASCCDSELEESPGLVAAKPTVVVAPVVALLAILTEPGVLLSSATHSGRATDWRSTGPPGVPTYLFVSSFRI